MLNFDIKTTIMLQPRHIYDCSHIRIIRASTANLNFSLANKLYTLSDIKQLTFSFKQNDNIWYYNMYDLDSSENIISIDPHFMIENDDVYDNIIFTLSADETNRFKPTSLDSNYVEFEVTAELINTDNNSDNTIVTVEKQLPIIVLDSLYSEVLSNS